MPGASDTSTGASLNFQQSDALPFAHTHKVNAIAASPSGVVATAGSEAAINLWTYAAGGAETAAGVPGQFTFGGTLDGHVREVSALAFLGDFLLSGSVDTTLRVWQPAGGNRACAAVVNRESGGPSGPVTALTLFKFGEPAEDYFAYGSMDKSVRVCTPADVMNGTTTTQFACDAEPTALAMGSGGGLGAEQILLVGLINGNIEMRSPQSGFMVRATLGISSATRVGHAASGPVRALFAGEGYWCSGGEDGKLMVWQWSGPMPAPPS